MKLLKTLELLNIRTIKEEQDGTFWVDNEDKKNWKYVNKQIEQIIEKFGTYDGKLVEISKHHLCIFDGDNLIKIDDDNYIIKAQGMYWVGDQKAIATWLKNNNEDDMLDLDQDQKDFLEALTK